METSNVVNIADRATIADRARQALRAEKVFQREDDDLNGIDVYALQKGAVIPQKSVGNRALEVAAREHFLDTCLPILWGDEKERHFHLFGEVLRGAVITFKPQTRMELLLLKNVIAAQWRLERLYLTQSNIYDHESRTGEVGRYGLPKASHTAMELDELIYKAQESLEKAVTIYANTLRIVSYAKRREPEDGYL